MSAEHKPVRVTPTHAGPDSKGIVSILGWDLEGMVAFYLVGGGVAGMLLAFCLVNFALSTRIGAGLVPVAVSAVWVRVFVHGRPPAYQADVLERWRCGGNFRLSPQGWTRRRHPHALLLSRMEQREARHG